MNEVKKGLTFYSFIYTDHYGCLPEEWKHKFFNLQTGTTYDGTNPIEEVIVSITGAHTATVKNKASVGEYVINTNAGGTIVSGDIFSDVNGNIHRVAFVDGTYLTILYPLRAEIPAGTTLTQAGNVGTYKILVDQTNTLGQFALFARNLTYGIATFVDEYTVVNHKVDDVLDQLYANQIEINTRMDTLQSILQSSYKMFIGK